MVAAEINKTQEAFFSELPIGWRYDRLKDVVSLRNDKTSDKSSEENYLELEDIEQGTGNLLSKKNTLDVESAVIRFKKGDVLFGKLRPYLEKYYYADFDGKCTGEILAFYPRGIKGHFLRYCVAAPWFIGKCNAIAYGAKMPRVNWPKQLALFDIPIPTINEQIRIAAYLDKTCAAIDKAIEAKQKQLEILDALRKSITHKAVTRGLDDSVELKDSNIVFFGMVPIDWKPTKFRYEISIRNGDFISDKLDEDGSHPVVGGNGFMGMTNDFNVDEEVIAIGRVGAYCGNVHLVTKQSWISDNALIVKSMHDLKYLVYVFIALDLNSEANKTAQPVITGTKIKNIRIAIPTREEQSKIAFFLDGKLSELQHIKENIQQQISTLEQYRKSLIHECVTGKRRVTDGDVQDQL